MPGKVDPYSPGAPPSIKRAPSCFAMVSLSCRMLWAFPFLAAALHCAAGAWLLGASADPCIHSEPLLGSVVCMHSTEHIQLRSAGVSPHWLPC